MKRVCYRCNKGINTILKPCPHCGYQHPLTDAGTKLALRQELEAHGYKLYKIVSFKNYDRIHFGNKNIKLSLNLRSKISQIALKTIVEACIGSKKP